MAYHTTNMAAFLYPFLLLYIPFATGFLSDYEYQSLKDIYDDNGGEYWVWGKRGPIWNFDSRIDPCNDGNEAWQGIKCSADPSECAVSTCSVTSLILTGYNLTGQLPSSLGLLFQLTVLDLSDSDLYGSVPTSIGNLVELTKLYVENSRLQYTIPTEVGRLTQLKSLSFSNNYLSGEVPSEIGYLLSLTSIYLSDNLFDGQIPPSIGNLQSVQYFTMADNYLTGILPETIGALWSLIVFSISKNLIMGTIPPTMRALVALESFEAIENHLTGSMPTDMGNLHKLQTLLLSGNSLTGSIPYEFGQLSSLVEIEIQDNFLSGHLSPSLSNCSLLQHMHIFNNRFEGHLPEEYGQLRNLVLLQAQGNELSGNLKGFLQYAEYMSLINLDLSDNLLTGQIPPQLFELPQIETIALSSNCFTGSIPNEICTASQLTVLSMDGLSAADGCSGSRKNQKHHFPYLVALHSNTLQGTFPNCIMSHPNLTVVHFAGNGLKGTVNDLPRNSKLLNLSLAHNHLSGTIPSRLKEAVGMLEVDLSFNKLTGDCHGILDGESLQNRSKMKLHLHVNRLSGVLPNILTKAGKINVLTGNLFACENIPRHDKDYEKYTCGSTQLDSALFTLIAALATVCIVVLIGLITMGRYLGNHTITLSLSSISECTTTGYRIFRAYLSAVYSLPDSYKNVKEFCSLLIRITKVVAMMFLVGFALCFPLYIMKFADVGRPHGRFSTRMHMYSWLLSAAYVTGRSPAAILLLAWTGVVYILLVSLHVPVETDQTDHESLTSRRAISLAERKEKAVNYFQITAVFILNAVIVFTANSFYVMTALNLISVPNATGVIIQISLAVFKYIYTVIVFPSFKQSAFINILALLFNSIFVPLLVTGVTSDSCYLVSTIS